MDRRLQLSVEERDALKKAFVALKGSVHEHALSSLLERSTPPKPRVRYVVRCKSRFGTIWLKAFFEKEAAQSYARYACSKWCNREGVRIMKQKWIPF